MMSNPIHQLILDTKELFYQHTNLSTDIIEYVIELIYSRHYTRIILKNIDHHNKIENTKSLQSPLY